VVATGSVRRRAQLAWIRPDLTFTGLRGNIPTRLERVPPGGAVVVAAAALARLELTPPATEVLEPSVMVPQVGQGAIGVECRADDERTRDILAAVDDHTARTEIEAERAYLARLGGGCDLPVGAHARLTDGRLEIEGLLATPDGRVVLRASEQGAEVDAHRLGVALADAVLAAGGSDLIDREAS